MTASAGTGERYRTGEFRNESSASSDWQAEVSRLHGRFSLTTPDAGDTYSGELAWQETRTHRLVRWFGEPERLARTGPDVARDPRDACELLAPVAGRIVVEQCGQRATLTPGDMIFVPLDRPTICEHDEASSAVTLMVPYRDARGRLSRRTDSLFISRRAGLGHVAFGMLESLVAQRNELDAHDFDAACDHFLELCTIAAVRRTTLSDDHRDEITAAIRRYVRDHAHDPDLTPSAVAAALGWSVRQVQTILRGEGTTPTDLIRSERLALARARLTDPRDAARSIADVAFSCGFGSHSAFCRVFRAHFGMSPAEMRQSVRA